ncbi:MAG: hypothetical protein GC183_04065 [Thiobacillus sp.]|nr:hypothetical protein [Thiobacillus sp.]
MQISTIAWGMRSPPSLGPSRTNNLKTLKNAPPRLARMLGVPIVHGSYAGPFNDFYSPGLPDVPDDST